MKHFVKYFLLFVFFICSNLAYSQSMADLSLGPNNVFKITGLQLWCGNQSSCSVGGIDGMVLGMNDDPSTKKWMTSVDVIGIMFVSNYQVGNNSFLSFKNNANYNYGINLKINNGRYTASKGNIMYILEKHDGRLRFYFYKIDRYDSFYEKYLRPKF